MTHLYISRSVTVGCAIAITCQLSAQIWKGKSGNYAIECSAAKLKATQADNGRVAFDAAAEADAAWAGFVRNSNGAPMEAEFTYRLLSAVGPYLSVEEGVYCDCGGAHPTAAKRFRAVDLERGSQATLTALFPEHAVFGAFLADPIVAKTLAGGAKPESMTALLGTLQDETAKVKDCEYGFSEDLLSSFAFYDTRDGNVSVRVSLPSAEEVCRGEMIQLGLTLPVPEALRAWFSQAKAQREGLLMVDAARAGHPSAASFKFSQKKQGRRK